MLKNGEHNEEIDDDELFDMVAEKKTAQMSQEQLNNVLSKLLSAIESSNGRLSGLLGNNSDTMREFVDKIGKMKQQDFGNLEKEIRTFNQMAAKIIEGQQQIIEAMKLKPKTMTAVRTNNIPGSPIKSFEITYAKVKPN